MKDGRSRGERAGGKEKRKMEGMKGKDNSEKSRGWRRRTQKGKGRREKH